MYDSRLHSSTEPSCYTDFELKELLKFSSEFRSVHITHDIIEYILVSIQSHYSSADSVCPGERRGHSTWWFKEGTA